MKDVRLHDYIMETEENEDNIHCKVENMSATSFWMMTMFPLKEVMGSRFGTYMCGFPRMMGIPCVHMAVVLMPQSVEGLNKNNFMQLWWMISQMHLQYPVNIKIKVGMDIASLILVWRTTTFVSVLRGQHPGK